MAFNSLLNDAPLNELNNLKSIYNSLFELKDKVSTNLELVRAIIDRNFENIHTIQNKELKSVIHGAKREFTKKRLVHRTNLFSLINS